MMDFDKVRDLDDAGIDAFDFSLMDEDERREALQDAGLDADDYDGVEYDLEFDAWQNLQDAGLSFREIEDMDDEERAEVLQEHDLDPDDYEDIMPPIIPAMTPAFRDKSRVYRYCTVQFSAGSGRYSYLVGDIELHEGDYALVPVGPDNKPTVAKVVSICDCTEASAPYPPQKTKSVLRKATSAEAEREMPGSAREEPGTRKAAETAEEMQSTSDYAPYVERTESGEIPYNVDSEENQVIQTKRKWDPMHWMGVAVAILLVTLISASIANGGKPLLRTDEENTVPSLAPAASQSTSTGTSTYHSSYSSTPPCPPVNREKAMTREEAERLSGTGYHNTRPNSSAENLELAAAQTKCKNCGYRTHNGANSLCDYCRWMERYGGGLPTSSNTSASSATTTKPSYTRPATYSPSTKDDDPYHAKSYSDPEDFYYDYYDDFWEFEEAEDYWNEHH